MGPPKIDKPSDKTFTYKNFKVALRFSKDFQPKWEKRFHNAQVSVDNDVLKYSDPYIPFRTGVMKNSGPLNTIPGNGLVRWKTPYVRYQYFLPRKAGTPTNVVSYETGKVVKTKVGNPIEPLRGPFWFERMIATWGRKIVANAKKMISKK